MSRLTAKARIVHDDCLGCLEMAIQCGCVTGPLTRSERVRVRDMVDDYANGDLSRVPDGVVPPVKMVPGAKHPTVARGRIYMGVSSTWVEVGETFVHRLRWRAANFQVNRIMPPLATLATVDARQEDSR